MELFRIIFQITKEPYLIGSILLLAGYTWALLSRVERPITRELIDFHRKEQRQRLKLIFQNFSKFKARIEET